MKDIFKHDSIESNNYLLECLESPEFKPLKIPTTVVLAKDDSCTAQKDDHFHIWEYFVEKAELLELDSGGHFFTRTRPKQVADLVAKVILNLKSAKTKSTFVGGVK